MEIQKKSEIYLEVGERLRITRELLGYRRQKDFGQDMGGLTTDQISRAECGDNPPPVSLLVGLAKKGININFILTGDGPFKILPIVRLSSPINPSEFHDLMKDLNTLQDRVGRIMGITTPNPPESEAYLQAKRRERSEGSAPNYRIGKVVSAGYRTVPSEDLEGQDWHGKFVPVINRIAAGEGVDTAEAESYAPNTASCFVEYAGAPPKAIAVEVTGDSMEPDFRDRDIVIVDPENRVESGLACVILNRGGSRYPRLKYVKRRGKTIVLESRNSEKHPPQIVPVSQVVGFFRIFKHLPQFVEEST